MPSLSKFSFWMLVAGFVLFVLSAAPTKVFAFTEGHESVVFLVAVILTVVGALGFIVNREVENIERSISESIDSVWRSIDNNTEDIRKDIEGVVRRVDNLEG